MEGLIQRPTAVSTKPTIFDRMSVLADPIRCRLLLILERQELTVSEICTVLQLPQSTASRHLKVLADDGWVTARREGTSRRYLALPDRVGAEGRRLWQLVREQLADASSSEQDRRRLAGVQARRRTRSQEFFSSAAGQWAQLRQEMFGSRFDLEALVGLLDEQWVVGDLGCGTGQTAASLAPFVDRIVAVDDSDAMLEAAERRLEPFENVVVRRGRIEALPIENGALDAATLVLVLHHLPEPLQALEEVERVLKPGGRLLVVDMLPHDREEYRQQMGHIWLGFSEAQIGAWLDETGLGSLRFRPLPPDPEAKGPTLFTATARKPSIERIGLPEQSAAGGEAV
ncbi:MAG: metalloregulator ArsR/SmtB family transcription factor [Thermoanaerobaculia bacterium]